MTLTYFTCVGGRHHRGLATELGERLTLVSQGGGEKAVRRLHPRCKEQRYGRQKRQRRSRVLHIRREAWWAGL